jgi:hypothetical protein
MSLYHALFGVNPFSNVLLEMLGISPAHVPRYRDCYLNEDGTEIIIHTRTGGGNRGYYEHPDRYAREYPEYASDPDCYKGPWNADLRKLPGFKYDADDDFDCTYADFRYEVPEEFKPMVAQLRELGAVNNPAERWQKLLADMQSGDKSKPEVQRALAVGEKIFAQINEALKSKPQESGSKSEAR